MVSVQLDAPATPRQLAKLKQLGVDTKELELTVSEASAKIDEALLADVDIQPFEIDDSISPFTEAHVTIIEGAQRGGKTCTAVGKIKDSYDCDCVRNYCLEELHWQDFKVKSYDRKSRIAKVKKEGETKYIKIPDDYKLHTDMRIFSNVHLFGMKYVYIKSFRHLLVWLRRGIIRKGWLLIDEAHKGMNARAGMTSLGQELEKQGFEFGKMQLDVIIITHMPRLIDWALRTIPTEHISCAFNKKTFKVTCEIRKKGEPGTREVTYDATQYWPYYWTNEKVNA